MFPHERSLVKRLQNKPFALLGIDLDGDRDQLKTFVVKEKVIWRNWFDGSGGPIAEKYQVQGIPILFLLDHTGVIRRRFEGVQSEAVLDKAVDALVQQAEGEKVSFLSK
jgi:hypothetical protein